MLMKYALYLANQETIDESQEILVFLTKFQGQTGSLAKRMLDQMGNTGQLEAAIRPIDKLSFNQLNSKLVRTISRGKRIEDLLNTMGDVFEFTVFFRSVQDTILSICEEELAENQKAQEAQLILLSKTFDEIIERDHDIDTRTLEMFWTIDMLESAINKQIDSLQEKAEKQAKMSGLGAIAGLVIPGVPLTKAVKNTANAIVANEIADKLSGMECEDLPLLNFLTEFAGDFCQLGTDFSLLRTPEDFQNFERKTLKEFFSGELISMLSSPEFYDSFDCLLGLVDLPPSKPPSLGLVPGLPGLTDLIPNFDTAEVVAKLLKLQNLIENIMTCSHKDQPVLCFSDKCPEITRDFNLIFGSSLDCRNSVNFSLRFIVR